MALDDTTVLARADGLLESEIDGEAVMMSIDKGEYYGLDAVGTEIWRLLVEPRSFGEICSELLERYEVQPERCRADVGRFLAGLIRDGTLRIVEPEGAKERPASDQADPPSAGSTAAPSR